MKGRLAAGPGRFAVEAVIDTLKKRKEGSDSTVLRMYLIYWSLPVMRRGAGRSA